jgi:hypothetical protein
MAAQRGVELKLRRKPAKKENTPGPDGPGVFEWLQQVSSD